MTTLDFLLVIAGAWFLGIVTIGLSGWLVGDTDRRDWGLVDMISGVAACLVSAIGGVAGHYLMIAALSEPLPQCSETLYHGPGVYYRIDPPK